MRLLHGERQNERYPEANASPLSSARELKQAIDATRDQQAIPRQATCKAGTPEKADRTGHSARYQRWRIENSLNHNDHPNTTMTP